MIWHCCIFDGARREHLQDAELEAIKNMPNVIRAGIPIALILNEGLSYWGEDIGREGLPQGDPQRQHQQYDGTDDRGAITKEAKDLIEMLTSTNRNARQIAAYLAQASLCHGQNILPAMPHAAEEPAPEQINAYSDGAVKRPGNQMTAIGGDNVDKECTRWTAWWHKRPSRTFLNTNWLQSGNTNTCRLGCSTN